MKIRWRERKIPSGGIALVRKGRPDDEERALAHILLVGDNEDLNEMNRTMLAGRGHQVTVAHSAVEARHAAQLDQPDAAVLDLLMEDKTAALDLARRLRSRRPDLPVVILTGIRNEMVPGFSLGVEDAWLPVTKYLEKPVSPRVLADELEKMLSLRA